MSTHSRLVWNGIRLGLTFSLGIGGIALVTRLGSDALGLYLYLLGWRWTVQFLIDAVEAAHLSRHADGRIPGWPEVRGITLVTVGILALSAPLGWQVVDPGYRMALCLGTIANCVIVGTQIFAADRLAAWVLAGSMGRYNGHLMLRRTAEFLAVAGAVFLTVAPASALELQYVLLIGGAFVVLAALPPRPERRRDVAFDDLHRQRFWQSALVGASTSLAARAPAVILPVFGGAEAGLLAGVMVVMLGYVRQAGSVVLGGLDGAVRRRQSGLSPDRPPPPIKPALRLLAAFMFGIGLWAGVGPFLHFVLPVDVVGGNQALIALALRCALLGALIRLWAEARIKALSGYGLLGRTGRNAFAPTALYLLALVAIAARLAPTQALLASALAYLALQIVLFALVTLQSRRSDAASAGPSRAAPSLPAE